jgi:hypothetical protein
MGGVTLTRQTRNSQRERDNEKAASRAPSVWHHLAAGDCNPHLCRAPRPQIVGRSGCRPLGTATQSHRAVSQRPSGAAPPPGGSSSAAVVGASPADIDLLLRARVGVRHLRFWTGWFCRYDGEGYSAVRRRPAPPRPSVIIASTGSSACNHASAPVAVRE